MHFSDFTSPVHMRVCVQGEQIMMGDMHIYNWLVCLWTMPVGTLKWSYDCDIHCMVVVTPPPPKDIYIYIYMSMAHKEIRNGRHIHHWSQYPHECKCMCSVTTCNVISVQSHSHCFLYLYISCMVDPMHYVTWDIAIACPQLQHASD